MRSEQEMFDLILGFARLYERIRAVWMNGSRANPEAPRDIWQDYDIVYVCQDVLPFVQDKTWLPYFGKMAVCQEPDASVLFDDVLRPSVRYAYLMQFADGTRIDLALLSLEEAQKQYGSDSLTVPLLDKDGLLKPVPATSDRDYRVKKPTEPQYDNCCNEFWWCAPYVVKGLLRREPLYALDMMNSAVRPMLLLMLDWLAGVQTDFSVCTGKCGKYLDRYLPKETFQRLLATYPAADSGSIQAALTEMWLLFDETARSVGQALGYEYHSAEADGSRTLMTGWLSGGI